MRDGDTPEKIGGDLAEFGAMLIGNGYNIVPINHGDKAPRLKGWPQLKSTKEDLKKWLSPSGGYFETGGVGVTTKNTPAVDIDVLDADIAEKMEEFVRENLGAAPVRIGQAPKRMMVFRTDEPFTKMTSKKYEDMLGCKHQIEILGDGQQFVAYHIHPKTGRPYYWPNGDGIATTKYADLISVTRDQCVEVIEFFESLAAQMSDWEVVGQARVSKSASAADDNVWGTLKNGSPLEEVRDALMNVSDSKSLNDRQVWLNVGMALHFEYDASDEAFELWCEWAKSADDDLDDETPVYDEDDQVRVWASFGKEQPGKNFTGVAYIFKLRNEEMQTKAAQELPTLKAAFHSASTKDEWQEAVKAVRKSEIGPLDREDLVNLAKKRIDLLLDSALPISQVRKMLAYEQTKNEKIPNWLQGWVYDTENDEFLHTRSKQALSRQGFCAQFDRCAYSKKDRAESKSRPSSTADDVALNIYEIEMVHGTRYGPGELPIYDEDGLRRANTYAEWRIPAEPDMITPRDKQNIKRIKTHIAHLLTDPKEQRMFLDWISWVVQHPGQRLRYSIVLQGTQGDGKSFFGQLMRYVMGPPNVRFLNASALHSAFNGWAVGQCVTCIEEVSIKGEDRYKVLNDIKEIMGNKEIGVTFKGKDPVTLRNTTNYLLFTNHQDAMPIDQSDRRYMVFFSQWQQKHELLEFMKQTPDYYVKLYGALSESAPAIRKWLLEHEQGDEFDENGMAPETKAREIMIDCARPQFVKDLISTISEKEHHMICDDLISMDSVETHFEMNRYAMPAHVQASFMMRHAGYVWIGRIRIDGRLVTFFSKFPRQYQVTETSANEYAPKKIRAMVEKLQMEAGFTEDSL